LTATAGAVRFDVQVLLSQVQQLLPRLSALAEHCQQCERDMKQQAAQQQPLAMLQLLAGCILAPTAAAKDTGTTCSSSSTPEQQQCNAASTLHAFGELYSPDAKLQSLPEQLQLLEQHFAARLPHGWCCNNLSSCSKMAGSSELALVARRSSICAGCGQEQQLAARYCSRQCREQHWELHRQVCAHRHRQQQHHGHEHCSDQGQQHCSDQGQQHCSDQGQQQHHHHDNHQQHHYHAQQLQVNGSEATAQDSPHNSPNTNNAAGCCSRCGASGCVLHRCSRCMAAAYCSRQCQAADWEAAHRQACSGDGSVRGPSSTSVQ
jgi:hypothetical protein